MKTIGELVVEAARARHLAQAVEPEPETTPAPPATEPAAEPSDAQLKACREKGKALFQGFDACQHRLIEAEVLSGGKNYEERTRLRATVKAIREWVAEAKQLGILADFEREIRLFLDYLRYEADEAARAEKVELPWKIRLFIESGEDVTAAARKPVQYLDYDPDRCLHPR